MKDPSMFWNLVTVKVSTGSLSEILGPDVFKSGVFFFLVSEHLHGNDR